MRMNMAGKSGYAGKHRASLDMLEFYHLSKTLFKVLLVAGFMSDYRLRETGRSSK